MKIINAVTGEEILVDDALYEVLSRKRWYIQRGKSKGSTRYARCYHKGEHLYMHRLIMGEPHGFSVDHLDEDGLNNQRANLEIVTPAENTRRVTRRARARLLYEQWQQGQKVYSTE